MLQCFALQHYIASQGYDVQVLDYLGKEYKKCWYEKLRIWIGDCRRNPIKYLKIALNAIRYLRRKYLFSKFLRTRIHLTTQSYKTSESLKNNLLDFDIFIAGSDQIWNPRLGGFKPVYFLKFVPENRRKISYAASFGIGTLNEEELQELSYLIADFDSLSCRENSGTYILKNLKHNAITVIDPVFLITANYWHSISDKCILEKLPQKFVLTYFLSPLNQKRTIVASITNMKHVDLSTELDASCQSIIAIGPEQFLSLICNCNLLITDSFHGMAFALIFHKNFYVVPRHINDPNSQNARIENLLEQFELKDRWLADFKLPVKNENIDYEKVSRLMQISIEKSSKWLISQLYF